MKYSSYVKFHAALLALVVSGAAMAQASMRVSAEIKLTATIPRGNVIAGFKLNPASWGPGCPMPGCVPDTSWSSVSSRSFDTGGWTYDQYSYGSDWLTRTTFGWVDATNFAHSTQTTIVDGNPALKLSNAVLACEASTSTTRPKPANWPYVSDAADGGVPTLTLEIAPSTTVVVNINSSVYGKAGASDEATSYVQAVLTNQTGATVLGGDLTSSVNLGGLLATKAPGSGTYTIGNRTSTPMFYGVAVRCSATTAK